MKTMDWRSKTPKRQVAGSNPAEPTISSSLLQGRRRDGGDALRGLVSPLTRRPIIWPAGAVKLVMIDPDNGVMHGGVSPAKDDYVLGW